MGDIYSTTDGGGGRGVLSTLVGGNIRVCSIVFGGDV